MACPPSRIRWPCAAKQLPHVGGLVFRRPPTIVRCEKKKLLELSNLYPNAANRGG